MRRHLHIAVALVTFACGFVVAGASGGLPSALPLALVAFLLFALSLRLGGVRRDAHRLKVVALTLLLWLAPLAFFSLMLNPPGGDCITFEGADSPRVDDEDEETAAAPGPPAAEDFGRPARPFLSPLGGAC